MNEKCLGGHVCFWDAAAANSMTEMRAQSCHLAGFAILK